MSVEATAAGPRARAHGVIVRQLGDETLIYDRATHEAHCLNRSASLVLSRCDGATPPGDMARALARELDGVSEAEASDLVALALVRLTEAGLLEASAEAVAEALPSRRAALRALATTSVLPLVLSVVAPTPADAQTCIAQGGNCSSSTQCCPDSEGRRCCRQTGPQPPRCLPGGGNCLP